MPRMTDEQAVHTAVAVSASLTLAPAIAYIVRETGSALLAPGQAGNVLAGVFPLEVRQEMTNVFSFFMGTCVNMNHIKASFIFDVVGHDPQIYIATNQAEYGENSAGLKRSTVTIEKICKQLAGITPDNARDVRRRVLTIVANAVWPRLSHHFGITCPTYCEKANKDARIPEFLPDKLVDITVRLAAAGLAKDKYGRLMEDTKKLDKTLRSAFQTADPPDPTAKRPVVTGVKLDDKTKTLEAVHRFYQTYKKLLKETLPLAPQISSPSPSPPPSTSTPMKNSHKRSWAKKEPIKDVGGEGRLCAKDLDLIRRFENICPYVDGVNFLCNVALGYAELRRASPPKQNASGPRRKLDNTKIVDWFSKVKVVSCMLPRDAFPGSGEPDPSQCLPLATASSPGATERLPTHAQDQFALDQDQLPESPPSPASSSGALSASSDDAPQPSATQYDTPNLFAELKRQGLDAMHRVWSDRIPHRKDNGCRSKSRKKKKTDEAVEFAKSYKSAMGQDAEFQPKVHAEIILLLKIEELMRTHGWRLDDGSAPAIYIASFKKACYCCHKLILASKMNIIAPPTHSIIYTSWRLPTAFYFEKYAPTATEWPTDFCKRLWDILRTALSRKECWLGEPPARAPSEDLELRTFPLLGEEAYEIGHWAKPASATVVCGVSLHTAGNPTLDPKSYKRPADASTLIPRADGGKRPKGKSPAFSAFRD
ncbi:hypothetical protein F503_04781 [Ophiostoma piceae UAMH 11346]|uniref:Uncharacterized protein n=1 Tax=Ophiostoma piceae (strain UAMH 11346) TaxID=1262450 RepID=S3BXV3_OPHP1|nr:hypothetical protein F503_04781 [Ophiostoma piceae UAMH 11346]